MRWLLSLLIGCGRFSRVVFRDFLGTILRNTNGEVVEKM
jgi:hypothetical protein